MKKVFIKHSEAVLVALAALFLVAIIGAIYTTVQSVAPQVNRTLITPVPEKAAGFDLTNAESVNYRGISTSSATAATGTPQ